MGTGSSFLVSRKQTKLVSKENIVKQRGGFLLVVLVLVFFNILMFCIRRRLFLNMSMCSFSLMFFMKKILSSTLTKGPCSF